MSLSSFKVVWYVLDDEEWRRRLRDGEDRAATSPLPFADMERKIRHWLFRGAVLTAVALWALAGAGTTSVDLARMEAEAGVRSVLKQEEEARARIDREGLTRLFAPEISSRLVREWSVLGVSPTSDRNLLSLRLLRSAFLDQTLWVEVEVAVPEPSWRLVSPYRENRFYRDGAEGWLRTMPNREFWGARHLLQNDYLRFDFTTRDAALVERIAPRAEAIYVELHQMIGLDPDASYPYAIHVTPDIVSGRGIYLDRLEITSPHLSKIPADLSEDDYLLQQITSGLVYRTVEAREFISFRRDSVYRWRDLQRGMRYWLEDSLTQAEWPWDAQGDALFRQRAGDLLPLSVSDIGVWPEGQARDLTYYTWRNAAAKSLVAYIVHDFGVERLPDLYTGFERYRSRAAFIDGLYGITVSEFEAGWNRFLVESYGVKASEPVD